MSDVVDQVETKSNFEKVKLKISSTIGYLLPFVASMPPMTVWGGLMTVPFAVYLLMMIFNLTESPPLPDLMNPLVIITTIIQLTAISLLIWSIIYLHRKKDEGLVSSGPYRIIRHPQYFSLIILTLLMSFQSIWILKQTFGIGWLSIEETKVLWVLMLAAYGFIASFEEMHLEKEFGYEWTEYRNRVGFLIPFLKHKSHLLEILSGILVPYAILEIILYLPV